MPKIIDNLQQTILIRAKKQIKENGFSKTTIRSIAKECNIAVGTIYNYFGSKNELTATFILQDWAESIEHIKAECEKSSTVYSILKAVWCGIFDFKKSISFVEDDKSAQIVYLNSIKDKSPLFRLQIASLIENICIAKGKSDAKYLSVYIANAMLSQIAYDGDFEQFYAVTRNLFNE